MKIKPGYSHIMQTELSNIKSMLSGNSEIMSSLMPKFIRRIKRRSLKIYMVFSFTQEERDNVLKYYTLTEDIKKRLGILATFSSPVTVVFNKSEANEMLKSLSQAAMDISKDKDLENKLEGLCDRFELKYNEVFHK